MGDSITDNWDDATKDHPSFFTDNSFLNAGIKVILCSLLPANRYTWRPEVKPAALIKDLNARIQAYCTEKGYPYVDYWTPLADTSDGLPAEHSSDGVHPNQFCYTLMEGIILPVIQSVI